MKETIWPPQNYNKHYSRLFWRLIERPLAERGIYFPQKTSGRFQTFFDEHVWIDRLLPDVAEKDRVFVDIGAGDGIDMNNCHQLAARGWRGLSIEAGPVRFAQLAVTYQQFPQVALARCKVTPDNVVSILEGAGCPKHFAVLDLDIDSFDYFVLGPILKAFRPTLVLAEINPVIPPPLRFAVTFAEDRAWRGDHFQGMSLSALADLAAANLYDLVQVSGCSAFLVAQEVNGHPAREVSDLYTEGVLSIADRLFTKDFRGIEKMPPVEAMKLIRQTFADRTDEFILQGTPLGITPASLARR